MTNTEHGKTGFGDFQNDVTDAQSAEKQLPHDPAGREHKKLTTKKALMKDGEF